MEVLNDLKENYLHLAKNPHIEYEFEEDIKNYRVEIRMQIGQSNENFSFLRNVTEGLSIASRAIPLEKNSEVLLTNLEHRSAINCWYLRQISQPDLQLTIKICNIPTDATNEEIIRIISANISEQTRVIAIPHIDRYFGILFPVKKLCQIARELNITTVIDGAQSLGLTDIKFDDLGCDIYVSCLHKWFLSPMTIGTISIHSEIFSKLYRSFASSNRWNEERIENRQLGGQELGTRNVALEKSIGSLLDFHTRWHNEIQTLGNGLKPFLIDCLLSINKVKVIPVIDYLGKYGIITFYVEGINSKLIIKQLEKKYRILVGISNRKGFDMIRISLYFYNTRQDIQHFVKALEEIIWSMEHEGGL
ncbi:aminotransferase class V-fold PLP-dependent enzyme [Paenibacillus macerans]|uniref:aminotransferase class V-fold PLP-dependent enzyme n=1 Tax=Paenibacillus macerans TaxID=44252 RepID=UPI002E22F95C|nr:aminotransferase class V-fold PLP-dependent enzyme [Paenibacillus macerans]